MQRKKDTSILRGLQYFEAVARHQSMSRAAKDLGVTESAVSHQMRAFAQTVGRQLVVKSGRGIALTPSGEHLAQRLTTAFSGLESLVKDIAGDGRQLLHIAVCSSFGPGWLVPRLGGFHAAHPTIDVQLRLYAQDPALTDEVADAFVSTYPLRTGYGAVRIMEERLIAVQAPALRSRQGIPLITTWLEAEELGREWPLFCRRAGLKLERLKAGPYRQCTHYLLALEMARRGLGAALVPDFIAAEDLESERLVQLGAAKLPTDRIYNLCFKKSRAKEAKVVAFADWIKAQAAALRQRSR